VNTVHTLPKVLKHEHQRSLATRLQATGRILQYHTLPTLILSPHQISKYSCENVLIPTANRCRSRDTWGVALGVHHPRGMTSSLATPTPQLKYSVNLSSREILPVTMSRVEVSDLEHALWALLIPRTRNKTNRSERSCRATMMMARKSIRSQRPADGSGQKKTADSMPLSRII